MKLIIVLLATATVLGLGYRFFGASMTNVVFTLPYVGIGITWYYILGGASIYTFHKAVSDHHR